MILAGFLTETSLLQHVVVAAALLKSLSFTNGFAVGVLPTVSLKLVATRLTCSRSCNALHLQLNGNDKYQEKNQRNTRETGHPLLNIVASLNINPTRNLELQLLCNYPN